VGGHRLLAQHADGARQNRRHLPGPDARAVQRADAGVQSGQIAKGHQHFGALRQVIHNFGVERMDHPHQCSGQRQAAGSRAEARPERRQFQRAPDRAKQQEPAEHVQPDVREPVAGHVRAAHRVVQRERQGDHGSPRQRGAFVGLEDIGETANLRIVLERDDVIEQERVAEAVPVHHDAGNDDQRGAPPDAQRRGGSGSRGTGPLRFLAPIGSGRSHQAESYNRLFGNFSIDLSTYWGTRCQCQEAGASAPA
jgi:hypothetical protein